MPPVSIPVAALKPFGTTWGKLVTYPGTSIKDKQPGSLSRTAPNSSSQLGALFDTAVGKSLAAMLGGIPIDSSPNSNSLVPSQSDCVEVGPVRIVGGVRPQNFDVGYRPDGVRFAFDSKTLNDKKSIGKNWQNMINDLATEATTVHSRFPYAVVGFMVVYPAPAVTSSQLTATIGTLERLGGRILVDEPEHRAEALSLVLWDPTTGKIDASIPDPASPLRIERFSEDVERAYVARYKGLPPHAE
jgi:hypothetical protein